MNGKRLAAWMWSPLIALQFLTRIPVRGIPDWAYEEAREKAFVFYPVIGLLVGLAGCGVFALAHWLKLPDAACAILTIGTTACMTGALHEDGFADVADGLGPHDRESALKAMRDSRLGSFGSIALWTLLSLKAVTLSSIAVESVCKAIIAAHILSRWSSLPLSKMAPPSSSGLGSTMASSITWRSIALATVVAAALSTAILGPAHAIRCGIAACALVIVTGPFYRGRFGGITGDCLGATNQLVELATLLLMRYI